MIKLKKRIFLFCLVACFLVSCTNTISNPPQSTSNGPQPTAYADFPIQALATLGPEIKRFSGQGNNADVTITLDTKQFLRINWKQQCLSNFYLSMTNTSPIVTPDPDLDNNDQSEEIVLAIAANPSYGYSDYEFEAGTYKISVEADGNWEIWVERVIQEQEITATDEP